MTQLNEKHFEVIDRNKDRLYQHNKILDKLEQRISKLERVLDHLHRTELRIHDLKEIKNDR